MRLLLAAATAVLLMAPAAMADQASALQAVKAQGRVVDALMDNSGNLYVSVKPDAKMPWDQFAGALCKVVAPHKARIFAIRVVDLTAVNFNKRPQDWRRLGESSCWD